MMSRRRENKAVSLAKGVGLTVGMAAAAAGWWITYSNLLIDHHLPLRKAIDADLVKLETAAAGGVACYEARQAQGRPLLLVHSVNAAASSYEMGPIFSRYRMSRPVIAMDLPGFGFSERSNQLYTPRLYHEAILEVLEREASEPVDVVALSLGCEFAARAALIQPEKFHSLTLISPSGFSAPRQMGRSQRANQEGKADRLHRTLSRQLWGRPLYDLIATKTSIRWFLKQSFVGPVPEDMVDYDYVTAHQPGAQYAPLYFVSGRLFTQGILPAFYERLEQPVQVLFDQDAFVGFEWLPEVLRAHDNWQAARIIPSRGLPQFERMDDVARELDRFWAGIK
jgi:pimeloyl-ACP methyl ester carboxylesterase